MFLGELIEIVLHHLRHQIFETRSIPTVNLQQKTLLQRTGTDARRVECLQQLKHLYQFLFCDIDVMIDGQFVTDGTEVLTQQTIVVERTDQILHHIALGIVHIEFAHLFLQLVVERHALAIDHLLAFFRDSAATMIDGQFIIIAPQITKGIIERRLTLLTLTARLEVIGIIQII